MKHLLLLTLFLFINFSLTAQYDSLVTEAKKLIEMGEIEKADKMINSVDFKIVKNPKQYFELLEICFYGKYYFDKIHYLDSIKHLMSYYISKYDIKSKLPDFYHIKGKLCLIKLDTCSIYNFSKSNLCKQSISKDLYYKNIIHIGKVLYSKKLNEKALTYLDEVINNKKRINSVKTIGDAHTIKSLILIERKAFNEAENNLKLAENIYKSETDLGALFSIFSVLYVNKGDQEKMMFYFKKALSTKRNAKLLSDKLKFSPIDLSESNTKKNNSEAEKIQEDLYKSINVPFATEMGLKVNSKMSQNDGRYKDAVTELEKIIDLNNKNQDSSTKQSVLEFETKYRTEKKEKENLQLKADQAEQALILEREQQTKVMLICGLIISLCIGGAFFFFFRRNKKQKDKIETLQRELHHRIKNNLSIIDTFVEVAKVGQENESDKVKLNELQLRIDSINQVHEQLYANKQVTELNLIQYLQSLIKNIDTAFDKKNINVDLAVNPTLILPPDKLFPVGLIVNEFITNSLKHGFNQNEKGEIVVAIEKNKTAFSLRLKDSGKGLPEEFNIEKTASFGMRVMKLLSKQLGGSFEMKNNQGLEVNVTF